MYIKSSTSTIPTLLTRQLNTRYCFSSTITTMRFSASFVLASAALSTALTVPRQQQDPGLGSWTFTSYGTGNAPVGAWRSFTLQYSGSTTEITCDWNNFHGQLVDRCSDPAFSYTLGLRTADSQGECDSEGIDGWH